MKREWKEIWWKKKIKLEEDNFPDFLIVIINMSYNIYEKCLIKVNEIDFKINNTVYNTLETGNL